MRRLTKPSLEWAIWAVLLNEDFKNIFVVWFKPWRWYFAWLYLTKEGYFLSGDNLIAQDFKEPSNWREFLDNLIQGRVLEIETMPIKRVENFQFEPGLFWTRFQGVGVGNAHMPKVTTGDRVGDLQRRFNKYQQTAAAQRRRDELAGRAQEAIELADEIDRQRSERNAS